MWTSFETGLHASELLVLSMPVEIRVSVAASPSSLISALKMSGL